MKEITVEELLALEQAVIIDIRSPIEFDDGHIPGAINVPLFSNREREEIGTLYKQTGQAAAKWRAMEIVSPKIPDLLHTIKNLSDNGEVVIHCWRGGMRSKAVVTFLEFAGIYAWRLTGGYKAYRHYILEQIPVMFPEKAVVLHGLTGVGKTECLKILKQNGYPILDLEAMAGHRGSIFGTIGLGEGHNQKTFDALLFQGLRDIQGTTYFIIEAESKRIGKTVQPEELMDKKMHGININLETPLEARVKFLAEEYVHPFMDEPWYHPQIADGLEKVLRRIKDTEVRNLLISSLESKDYEELIRVLLTDYYDPRYDHARLEYEGDFINITANDPDEAAEKIASIVDDLPSKKINSKVGQF